MRVVFVGTGDIGMPVLRWLLQSDAHELVGIVTQPDKPVGREQRIQPPPIKAAAAARAIPILQPERIKNPQAVEAIRALTPEVIVVMAYGQILPRAVLEIPRLACLNLHASLLPRHRGAAPIQAAIAAGDHETGITVMYMDEGLDTGDILLQRPIPIADDETGGSLHERLAQLAPAALRDALGQLEAGTAPRTPQEETEASYAPKLEREHGGIDWSEAAESIERKIRAFDPWPGAHAILRDSDGRERKLKIFRATVVPDHGAAPGEVVSQAGATLVIGAQGGALRLDDVQLEGGRRMPAVDLLRGQRWVADAAVVSAK